MNKSVDSPNSVHLLLFPSWYPQTPHDTKGVFFRDQAQALKAHGYQVGVATVSMRSLRTVGQRMAYSSPTPYELDEGVPTYRYGCWAALPRIPYGNYILYRRAARKLLARYVSEQGWPDIIHAHASLFAGAFAVEWAKHHNIPVILTEHFTGFARGILRPWQLRLAAIAASRADACIAVSPQFGELLDRILPSREGQWKWIPNVVADRFTTLDQRDREDGAPIRFMNLALMSAKKGQRDLLNAFANNFGQSTDTAELWMAGDGPMRNHLEQQATQLGIASRVHFLGAVPPDDVPKLLAQVDTMVVASHYETFGVVAAEALMAGVPVIATRCGGPECIVEGDDGLLVPPGDIKMLGQAMYQMAEEIHTIDNKAIADRARARFSGQAVANQLDQIYKQVLNKDITP
ncbi:glycosyltransferase family 4 protein [Gammaproteobacteria bacterium 2W06]|nr:glycosyltransferase family 4 protein [Gammaproteobacteria bacterium 2W06]